VAGYGGYKKETEEPRINYASCWGRAAKSSEAEAFASSTIAGVLDGRNLAARLCGGGGVLGGLEPMANADRDSSGRLDGVRGEDRSAGACGYAGEGREGAHGDEHGREGGHHFGMLGREEVERVTGVDEPDGCLRHGCGDWGVCVMMSVNNVVSWEHERIYAPSPCGAAEAGTTAVVAVVAGAAGTGAVLGGAVVGFEEEDGKGNFQKPEELAGSALTTSLLFSAGVADDMEAFEGERTSQVPRLLGAGFSVSVSVLFWDFSVVGLLSPTVALRMGGGFFFSVCFVSVGSSETSSFSRPIIHQEPEDLLWTRTDSVFLSSMSPIRIRITSLIN
jgi:hypothetical protein